MKKTIERIITVDVYVCDGCGEDIPNMIPPVNCVICKKDFCSKCTPSYHELWYYQICKECYKKHDLQKITDKCIKIDEDLTLTQESINDMFYDARIQARKQQNDLRAEFIKKYRVNDGG